MTREEAAALMDNTQMGKEGSKEFYAQLKKAGLVAVFGYSDDNMELEGAIRDEIGAPSTIHLNSSGLIRNKCEDDDCPYFLASLHNATTIKATFKTHWEFETEIPHSTFNVFEDHDLFCTGIVFALKDVP